MRRIGGGGDGRGVVEDLLHLPRPLLWRRLRASWLCLQPRLCLQQPVVLDHPHLLCERRRRHVLRE